MLVTHVITREKRGVRLRVTFATHRMKLHGQRKKKGERETEKINVKKTTKYTPNRNRGEK